MDYDCIVFDTAPTGHTLRLLQFPAMLEKGLAKLMALRGTLGGALSQIGALLGADLETMQAQLVGRLEELKARAARMPASLMLPSEAMHGLITSLRQCSHHPALKHAACRSRIKNPLLRPVQSSWQKMRKGKAVKGVQEGGSLPQDQSMMGFPGCLIRRWWRR